MPSASQLAEPLRLPPSEPRSSDGIAGPTSNFTQAAYEDVVRRCKEYIVAGDIIQVVPSRRVARPTTADPFDIYRALRALNPSPYMYFLALDGFHIIGASPEALVQVEEGTVSMSSDYVRLSGQGKCPSRPLSYHRTVIRGT